MVDELLGILAHGDDIQVAARVFAVESLSEAARQIPVNFLHCLRAPQADLHLEVVERHPSGRFQLLILLVPWFGKDGKPGSEYHPLLVTEEDGSLRVVGFVLPWNEVMPQLESEMGSLMPLSIIWITRVMALKWGPHAAEGTSGLPPVSQFGQCDDC